MAHEFLLHSGVVWRANCCGTRIGVGRAVVRCGARINTALLLVEDNRRTDGQTDRQTDGRSDVKLKLVSNLFFCVVQYGGIIISHTNF